DVNPANQRNSHRAHRARRGHNDFSVFSAPSAANSLHTFENRSKIMSKTAEDFSKTFYPFLHEDEKRREGREGLPDSFIDELSQALVAKARESAEVKTHFFEENKRAILQASLAMARAFRRGCKLLVC